MKFLDFFKGTKQTVTTDNLSGKVSSDTGHRRFSDAEYQVLAQRHYVDPSVRTRAQNTDLHQIISYLRPSHEHSVLMVQDIERLRALAPEIVQAENIIVSSVISPNDLQDADPTISIDEIPNLSESTRKQLISLLDELFLKEYKLGDRMTKWLAEALFRSGAFVTLILPEGTLAKLTGHAKVGKEELHEVYTEPSYIEMMKKPVYSTNSSTKNQQSLIVYDRKATNPEADKKSAIENFTSGVISYLETENVITSKPNNVESLALESITARIVTELEEGDTLFLSENPEILRFGSKIRNYQKNKLGKDLVSLYDDKIDRVQNSQNVEENIIDLTPYIDDDENNLSAPFCMEIPAEAVIPICVPGSKTEKLGYFILVDAFGQPIEASKYLSTMMGCSTSGRIQASYAAMFGNKPTESGVQSNLFSNMSRIGNPWDLQQNAITRVFDYVLDETLRKKLKSVGLDEMDLGKYNSIATCMFYRLLEKKRTTLLFAPKHIVNYVAFDYREDGAGKSKLEDAQFILSLRVTFLVANIMAMMRNAVAKKEVEVSFDEKETQFESVLNEVRQAMNEKYRFSLSSDPTAIAQSINNQNTVIKVASHPNAPGFDIKSTDTQSQVPKADSDLLDTLNSWFVTVLGIPHSLLNQLNEAEFSRSVATTNLFFSKTIRGYQKTLCGYSSEFIQTVVRFYPSFQKKMTKILEGSMKSNVANQENELEIKANTSNDTENVDTRKTALKSMVHSVIQKIAVGLPAPNIAPDRAQYEIFKDYVSLIDELVNNLFPDALVGDDSDISSTFNAVKSMFKSTLTKSFATDTGLQNAFDVPSIEDFILTHGEELAATLRIVRNTKKALERDKSIQTTETEEEQDTESTEDTTSTDSGSDSGDYGKWSF